MPNFVAGTEALRGIDPKCGTGYVQVQRGQGDFPHHELGNSGAKQLVNYYRLFVVIQDMGLSLLSLEVS